MPDTMDEIDEMENEYFERQAASEQAMLAEGGHPMTVQGIDGMPQQYYAPEGQRYYPLSLAQGVLPGTIGPTGPVQPATDGNILTARYAGVPGWGWGLITIGVLGGGYYLYKHGMTTPNEGEKDDDDRPALPPPPADEGGWSPSRTRFGHQLTSFIGKRGLPAKDIKVYTDADEAKRYCKPVSPLITLKCSTSTTLPMADLEKLCKKEGLTATDHGSGVVGLYPNPTGKRGRAWERYIDDLRDDGQTV